MEVGLMITKLILMLFLAITYIQFNYVHSISAIVLALLLYSCVNIAASIVKKSAFKRMLIAFSIVLILYCAYQLHPLFFLLLPLNLCELIGESVVKKWMVLLVLLPVLLVPSDSSALYVLVAAFTFFIYTGAAIYQKRTNNYEQKLDEMRVSMQKLQKHVNENKEYVRQSQYASKLEERNRLSQEIHDKIGHSMTGALIQMEAAKHVMKQDEEKALSLLQNAITISKEGIEEIRLTLKSIKPPAEQIGISRLKLFIGEFEAKHSIAMPLVYKGNLDLITPLQWKIIHENITEAITNALKYAEATMIAIELHVLNKMVKVEVKDNGKGAHLFQKGLGIAGMEERAASINGTVIVDGANGFSVTTLLPIGEKLHT
ncbi:histidine kinase [Priestia aryabhattai]|uniref:sensor histidine kinase n=1 Tax=Priestia aryabhattai TaxID=412384 RepID=UPI000490EB47|nr:histidine kinase [Priestia aryabhattai]MED4021421.1 histidine kinase [Priestia aryabhattai]PEI56377.1 two-component sensor histidine kinase [Priestia aryabhattai]